MGTLEINNKKETMIEELITIDYAILEKEAKQYQNETLLVSGYLMPEDI